MDFWTGDGELTVAELVERLDPFVEEHEPRLDFLARQVEKAAVVSLQQPGCVALQALKICNRFFSQMRIVPEKRL